MISEIRTSSEALAQSSHSPAAADVPVVAEHQPPRAEILAQIQRINAALIAWDQWENNQSLPPDVRRALQEPPLDRDELKFLRRLLLKQLRTPDAG